MARALPSDAAPQPQKPPAGDATRAAEYFTTMAEVEGTGYATRRASGRLQTKARAQPCPICGIVLAGDELLHADVRRALDALRSHLARFCRGAHSVDPRDQSIAENIGGLERVAARFAVNAAPDAFNKVADVVAQCAVRLATNGTEGDLEGLARALRALAFDAATARVYDAVVHVLPDAAKVLGAVAKLS